MLQVLQRETEAGRSHALVGTPARPASRFWFPAFALSVRLILSPIVTLSVGSMQMRGCDRCLGSYHPDLVDGEEGIARLGGGSSSKTSVTNF